MTAAAMTMLTGDMMMKGEEAIRSAGITDIISPLEAAAVVVGRITLIVPTRVPITRTTSTHKGVSSLTWA
jgi:hypothetical protein